MKRNLAVWTCAIALGALGVSACGAKVDRLTPNPADVTSLSLELPGTPDAADAGIYAAAADGAFRRAGLDVHITTTPAPDSTLTAVKSGRVDIAVTSEPELMLYRDQRGLALAFGAITQDPQSAIISIGSEHITSVADLRGKTIGVTPTTWQNDLLTTMLKLAHVPNGSVKRVAIPANKLVTAMTSKRVGATFGGTPSTTALQLRRDHKKPKVLTVSSAGVPRYDEMVFTCTERFFANHGSELRLFVQAVGRGYAAVRADPAAGANALNAIDPSLKPAFETASLKQLMPSLFPAGGKSWGWQFTTQWDPFGKWMVNHGLLQHPSWYEASTNQLLAGVGP
jgi:putative hydroxymethylpyrimidine transport system substrate-binding protein